MSGVWAASVVALWVFTLFVGFLLIGALRQIGLINLRLGPDQGALLITDVGLDRGTPAPDFRSIDASNGEVIHYGDLPALRRVLAFVSPTCMACRGVIEGLNEVAAVRKDLDFVVVCRDLVDACRGLADVTGLRARMLVDPTGEAEDLYQVTMTPFVYLVDERGHVLLRGVANDWRGVESLLAEEGTLQTGSWMDAPADGASGQEVRVNGRTR